MDVPATLRLWLTIGKPAAVHPLHCTTVSFSLDVALKARVEVMSTTLGLIVAVRVATRKSSHRTDATALQSNLLPLGVVLVNWIRAVVGRNSSTIQSS